MLKGKVPGITPFPEHEDDYIGVGMEALCRCCRDYDPKYKVPFSNYAGIAITNNIKQYHRKQVCKFRIDQSPTDPEIMSSCISDPKGDRRDVMDNFPCRIEELLGDLSPREQGMVQWLLDGGTQSEYARYHSISPQMASIIATRCVRKMRETAIDMGYDIDE